MTDVQYLLVSLEHIVDLSIKGWSVTFPTSWDPTLKGFETASGLRGGVKIDRNWQKPKSFTKRFSDSMWECLLTSGSSNNTVTGILLTVPPLFHTFICTPEFSPKKRKKNWHRSDTEDNVKTSAKVKPFPRGCPEACIPLCSLCEMWCWDSRSFKLMSKPSLEYGKCLPHAKLPA